MDHTYHLSESTNVPRTNYKSHKMCSVPQCHNRTCGDRNISLHCFPKDINVLASWMSLFKLGKLPKFACACSDHFCCDDFISSSTKRHLKPQAIPSRKLPTFSAEELNKQAQKENRQEWSRRKKLFYQKILTHPTEESVTVPKTVVLKEKPPPVARKTEVPVQVETGVPNSLTGNRPKILELIQNDAHMQLCTSLTIKQFHTIYEMVKRFMDQIPAIRSTELSISSKILLTLMKLKENHSFSHLSFLFNVDAVCCSSTFCEIIGILRQVLGQFITWPSKEEIRKHLPKELSNWPHTRVVIDCVEIEVASSSCLKCSNSFCSHLKNKPTIKFLVGMAPSGPVTFLTDVFDGVTPAKTILDGCGLLNLCEPGDTIIANRGFIMDEPDQAAEKPRPVEQSQFSNEVEDIKPVVAKAKPTRPAVADTRSELADTRSTANTRPALADIKSAANTRPATTRTGSTKPGNTKSVPKNMRPPATMTKPVPIRPPAVNTKPVPRPASIPVAANSRPPVDTKPVARAKVHIKTVERIKKYEIINSPITSEIFNGIDLIINVICALVNFTTTVNDK